MFPNKCVVQPKQQAAKDFPLEDIWATRCIEPVTAEVVSLDESVVEKKNTRISC